MNLLNEAVRNNAELCAAVLGAQGRVSRQSASLWSCAGDPLPFYPNAVTLVPAASDEVTAFIGSVSFGAGWGIKDSFADLVPGPGFEAAFEGTWLGRESAGGRAPEGWARVGPLDWEEWTAAWGATPVPFDRSLLKREDLAFWCVRRAERIVSGCLTNRSGAVTGFSNAFGLEDNQDWWAELVAGVGSVYPGPLVCWEQDPETLGAKALGFRDLGPLRVWLKREAVSRSPA